MTALHVLWLPVILSTVIVFVASALVHMVLPWHKNDYPLLPNQNKVMDALRSLNLPKGDYMIPKAADMAEMRSPAFKEEFEKGPMVLMTVIPKPTLSMSRNLMMWFVYVFIINGFGGYIAARALPFGAPYLHVFRFVGATCFLGYAGATWPESIWFQRSWKLTLKATFDGLLYALLAAGTYGWLWPKG